MCGISRLERGERGGEKEREREMRRRELSREEKLWREFTRDREEIGRCKPKKNQTTSAI